MNHGVGRPIKPGYRDDFVAMSQQVFRNWHTLEMGNRAACLWLSSQIDRLYPDLCKSPEFSSKVKQTKGLAAGNKPYHWIPVLEHKNCRSGLLFLPPGGQIAMHDHHESIGISIVLEGSPLISKCDRLLGRRHSRTPVVEETVSRRRLQPQQKSFIFPHKNNIHGFSSQGSSCLLFNTIFHKQVFHHPELHLPASPHSFLLKLCLSMHLCLSASVYACDTMLLADDAGATAVAMMPFDTLETVALNGDLQAQFRLAERYYCGHGAEKDLYRAAIWYRRAAERGVSDAQYQIGIMLLDGEGVTEDSNEGLEWIFQASQAGHGEATEVFNYLMANPATLDC